MTPRYLGRIYSASDERVALVERVTDVEGLYTSKTAWTLRDFDKRVLRTYKDDSNANTSSGFFVRTSLATGERRAEGAVICEAMHQVY